MRTILVLGGALFLLCGVSGCGTDVHDEYARDTLKTLGDINRFLDKITDGETADKYGGDLVAAYKKLKGLENKAKPFEASLSDDEKELLKEKYAAEFEDLVSKINETWERLKQHQEKCEAQAKKEPSPTTKDQEPKTKEKEHKTKEKDIPTKAKGKCPLTVLQDKGFPYPPREPTGQPGA